MEKNDCRPRDVERVDYEDVCGEAKSSLCLLNMQVAHSVAVAVYHLLCVLLAKIATLELLKRAFHRFASLHLKDAEL